MGLTNSNFEKLSFSKQMRGPLVHAAFFIQISDIPCLSFAQISVRLCAFFGQSDLTHAFYACEKIFGSTGDH
jgi:hypothetical protein